MCLCHQPNECIHIQCTCICSHNYDHFSKWTQLWASGNFKVAITVLFHCFQNLSNALIMPLLEKSVYFSAKCVRYFGWAILVNLPPFWFTCRYIVDISFFRVHISSSIYLPVVTLVSSINKIILLIYKTWLKCALVGAAILKKNGRH